MMDRDTKAEPVGGCGYQGYEFGAGSYPDSICVDGRLFDADDCDNSGGLYEPDEDVPCPICRRADAIEYWRQRNRLCGVRDRIARKSAVALVSDIRRNRGLKR
jgi:hypothetical protein